MANPEIQRSQEESTGFKHVNIDVVYGTNADIPGKNIIHIAKTPDIFSVGCVVLPYNNAVVFFPLTDTDIANEDVEKEERGIFVTQIQSIRGALSLARAFCAQWEEAIPNEGVSRTLSVNPRKRPGRRFHSFFSGACMDDEEVKLAFFEYERMAECSLKFNLKQAVDSDLFAMAGALN